MNEMGYHIACFTEEEVIVLTGIKEIYVGVPAN
jgi:hypothetical protein